MGRQQSVRIQNAAVFFPAILTAGAVVLGFYQLLPQQTLSLKLQLICAALFFLTWAAFSFIIRSLLRRMSFEKKILGAILFGSFVLTLGLVFYFQLSLPQKEFTIPKRKITLTTETRLGQEGTVKSQQYVFSSLNNGYRGIPLSAFKTDGSWVRDGDRLILITSNPEPASLTFNGRTGRQITLHVERVRDGGVLRVDWGDGSAESINLESETGESEKLSVAHTYFDQTRFYEWVDFWINLLSTIFLLWGLFALYFGFLAELLQRRSRSFRRVFAALTVFIVLVRLFNIFNLPLDWDEGTYSRAAMRYADSVLAWKFAEIPKNWYNHEHPAFIKLVYSVPVVFDGRASFSRMGIPDFVAIPAREDHTIFTSRFASAFFSVLTAQSVSYLFHPLAGFFFAIHSLASELSATARLEAIPTFFSFLALYFAWRALKPLRTSTGNGNANFNVRAWLFSAFFLGATAASKLIYVVIAFVIILVLIRTWIRAPRHRGVLLRQSFLYGVVALAAFVLLNPSLWFDPVARLTAMFSFHDDYQTDHGGDLPWYQPLIWATRSVPLAYPGNGVLSPMQRDPFGFLFAADELIVLLAAMGLVRTWKRDPVYPLWVLVGVTFMFLWGTKSQHYAMILVVPLCMMASVGTSVILDWIRRFNRIKGNDRS